MVALERPTTKGTCMADMSTRIPKGVLRAADVADLWTQERRKHIPEAPAYKAATVLSYLKESQPSPAGGKPHRYADNPMPPPAGRFGLMPWWKTSQREELLTWFRQRAGQGHGRGGWPAGRPRPGRTVAS